MSGEGRAKTMNWRMWMPWVFIVGAMWLGWQCLKEVAIDRLPVRQAVALAPNSPRVLARAAEAELLASRVENADELSRMALQKAPFNVRALRVAGLSAAQSNRGELADTMLTLAGNWSLRDDPTHAWLVETRLRRGDYGSAYAHADTLARRRDDLHPQLFELFVRAATLDPRAVPPLVGLLKRDPPWRYAFMDHLQRSREGLALSVALAAPLESGGKGRFTDDELFELYAALINGGYAPTAVDLRRRLQRPPTEPAIFNGEFSKRTGVKPFDWVLFSGAGVTSEIVDDDVRPKESALRVSYNGFSASAVAEQVVTLPPGRYRLRGQRRTELGEVASKLSWTIICLSGRELERENVGVDDEVWRSFSVEFEVPGRGCELQTVRLTTRAADRRSDNVAWYDGLSIVPNGARSPVATSPSS